MSAPILNRQLPLPVRLDDHARFDSFFSGKNAEVVHTLEQASAGHGDQVCWLWGEAGSGRSHLLQACVARSQDLQRRPIYLPLTETRLEPAALEDVHARDLVCLDDVDQVAGDSAWERGLFQLYEGILSAGSYLVLTSLRPAPSVGFALADLASRMGAATVYRLKTLNDDGRIQALTLRARVRGLELPPETAHYLLSRVPRENASLFRLLDQLDQASLAAGRRLTVPFVRELLSADA